MIENLIFYMVQIVVRKSRSRESYYALNLEKSSYYRKVFTRLYQLPGYISFGVVLDLKTQKASFLTAQGVSR